MDLLARWLSLADMHVCMHFTHVSKFIGMINGTVNCHVKASLCALKSCSPTRLNNLHEAKQHLRRLPQEETNQSMRRVKQRLFQSRGTDCTLCRMLHCLDCFLLATFNRALCTDSSNALHRLPILCHVPATCIT